MRGFEGRTRCAAVWLVVVLGSSLFVAPLPCTPQQPRFRRDIQLRMLRDQVGMELQGAFRLTELSPTVYVEVVGGDTRAFLNRFDQFLAEGEWTEAVDLVLRLFQESQPKLVMVEERDDFARYVPLPRYLTERLASLPGNQLTTLVQYRDRVDPLASQWYETASMNQDMTLLERIGEQLPLSSWGDDAALALGERDLERGYSAGAREHWESLNGGLAWWRKARRIPYWQRYARGELASQIEADMRDVTRQGACYPDSDLSPGAIWARLTLASMMEGNRDRSRAELALLHQVWPNVRGLMSGREVNYAEALTTLFHSSQTWKRIPRTRDWLTFAGTEHRNGQSETGIDIALQPTWRVPLVTPNVADVQVARLHNLPVTRPGEGDGRPCGVYPIVVGDLVFVYDSQRLRCLDIATGKPAWQSDGDGVFFAESVAPVQRFPLGDFSEPTTRIGEPRFTLTAHGTSVIATVGSNSQNSHTGQAGLIGFDMSRQGAIAFGPIAAGAGWRFLGAPLCDDDRCWTLLRQQDATAQDYVVCHNIRTGDEVWRTRTYAAETVGHGEITEEVHYLLTRNEETLFVHTGLGAVAALRATDGQIRWVTRYPRIGPKQANLLDAPWYAQRDMAPCVYYDGLLIVAPNDSDMIMALHAGSGEVIWTTRVVTDATQLLGVADGQLIVGGHRLWWLDVYTGLLSDQISVNPFPSSEFVTPRGVGRGVLAGKKIYWPTEDEEGAKIYVLRQRDGRAARQPIDLETARVASGNLTVTERYLLIAAPDELVAFELVRPGS